MTKNFILGKLTPFQNSQKTIVRRQDVNDIINGILNTHDQYKNEYDKISNYFWTGNEKGTTQKIWNFLKSNVPYEIESDQYQTLRSPSAILSIPGDCKSYSLYSNGILDSLKRKGLIKGDIVYRFAGYNGNKDYEHVFSVLKTDKGEIWTDPVLDSYNEKKQPTVYKDRKIKNMSLIAMAGIGDLTDTSSIDLSAPIDTTTTFDTSASLDTTGPTTSSDGTPLLNSDPTTGAYQENDGTWYLADGTALLNYDPKTGAYQEPDGTYYAMDGTALSYYDPTTGNYTEQGSNILYDVNGNVIGTQGATTTPTTSGGNLSIPGSGGGSSSGGGGGAKSSPASSTPPSALNSLLNTLNKLFPGNIKPSPRPLTTPLKTTTPTTSSNNTLLWIGLGAAAIYFISKKSK